MKKICMIAAAASAVALNAQAMDWGMNNMVRPYIGADYIYSHAKQGAYASEAKRDYNSWAVNAGMDITQYASLEGFFQQAFDRENHTDDGKVTSEFYAWGLDMYGRMPVMCSGFNLLASVGLADYNVKYTIEGYGNDKQRVGYRGGVGFSYDFTEHMSFRMMGRYSYVGMASLDNLMEVTAGLRYTF